MNWRDFDSPWQHSPFARDAEIDAIIAEVEALGKLAELGEADDWLAKGLNDIARPVAEATRLEAVRGRDYDALESVLIALCTGRRWEWKGYGGSFGEVEREDVFRRRAELRARLEKFRADAGANLAPLLRDELWPIVAIYEDLKRRAGRLDFLDLLLVARNLVRDNPAVRAELQNRFTHIFVDEFQDTDPLQAEILLLLSSADPAETNWLKVKPIPRQIIYRRRSETIDLPFSPRRRFALPGRQTTAADAWRATRASDGQLSRDARDSDDGQCRVRAADERGVGHAAGVCAADAVSRRALRRSRRSSCCRCRSRTATSAASSTGKSTTRFPRRLPRTRDGWCMKADGR